MNTTPLSTGYAKLTPLAARAVLAGLVLTTALLVWITLSPFARGQVDKPPRGPSDVELYRAVADRIHRGEGYYDASAAEMVPRHYPTRSVFNWRTPLLLWGIGHLPSPSDGKILLGFLAVGLMILAFEAMARDAGQGIIAPLICVALLSGPLMFCVLGDIFLAPALWAGVLIGLSIVAYGIDRPLAGVVLGILALLVRELALPYCVVATVLAWRSGRRRECAAWVLGMAGWLGMFVWHAYQVTLRIAPNALAHQEGWIQFGGAAFVLSTAQVNGVLLLVPQWVTALYFSAAMFGFAGWNTPLGRRLGLTVAIFVAAFSIAGQDFNQYWGSMIAPLYCFGLARAPASLVDILRRVRSPSVTTDPICAT
jgi:hypothetical protein